jgi:hypothetical protein
MNNNSKINTEFNPDVSIIEESDSDSSVFPLNYWNLKEEKEIAIDKSSKINFIELYKIITDTRKFEIENFWKRILYFWSTITLIFGGYMLVNNKDNKDFLIFISYLGFLYCIIFSFSLRGSKYWQEHWELLAIKYEKVFGFKLFRWTLLKEIRKKYNDQLFLFKPFRFSVSKITFLISDITLIFWLFLIIRDISYILKENLLKFDFGAQNAKIDFYTIAVIIIPIIIILYLYILIKNNFDNYIKESKKINKV